MFLHLRLRDVGPIADQPHDARRWRDLFGATIARKAINNIENSGYPSVDFAVYGKSKFGLLNTSVEGHVLLAILLPYDSQIPTSQFFSIQVGVAIQLAC